MQHQVWVLLHETEGAINLGSVCRAMANTNFEQLRFSGALNHRDGDAQKFAVHAKDRLRLAQKCADFQELTTDLDVLFGFTPRRPWDDGRNLDLDHFHQRFEEARKVGQRIGLLFGNERRGLTNDQLAYCEYRVALPTGPAYQSMNLAQAVLVVLWELFRHDAEPAQVGALDEAQASGPEKLALLNNLRGFLDTIGFLNPQNADHLWRELVPLFKARSWRKRELTLLHAIFGKGQSRYRALQRKLRDAHKPSGGSD